MVEEGFDARHDHCPYGVRGDAAGWVLGALDASGTWRFAEHLLTCLACQMTVAELQPAALALLATSPLRPPEHLAASALARVRQAARRTQLSLS
jgi:hypothetical protein